MKLVAESVETVRIPISAVQNGAIVDPTNSGGRTVAVAITAQGTVPPASYPITGTWEADSSSPPKHWLVFVAPGNLVRGTRYYVRAQLGSYLGDSPILEASQFIEAI